MSLPSRLVISLLAVLFSIAGRPASAGDAATLEILGFKANGSVFAFEEYGIQDGSGFPYANRFYIDTASDGFLPGTPVRVLIEDEEADVAQAREAARMQGQAIAADEELAANRGSTAAFNPVTELSADPHRVAVNPRAVVPPVDEPLEFRLTEIPVPEPEACRDLGPVKGFRLLRVDASPGGVTQLLHEDETVPQSRACPLGYAFAGVQTFFPQEGAPVYAVLIAVRRFGFEGPDFRYIAVTGLF